MQVWGAWQLRETSRIDQKRPPPSPPPPTHPPALFFFFLSLSLFFIFFLLLLHFGLVLSTDGTEREQSRRRTKVGCLEHEFHVLPHRARGVSMTVLKCTVSFRLLGVTVGDILIVT